MYKRLSSNTSIKVNESTVGETIENKVRRLVLNNEPIEDGAPIVFTERAEGVIPEYNIRTDKFDLALEATDLMAKQHLAKRQERIDAKGKTDTPPPPGQSGE